MTTPQPADGNRSPAPTAPGVGLRLMGALLALVAGVCAVVLAVLLVRSALG